MTSTIAIHSAIRGTPRQLGNIAFLFLFLVQRSRVKSMRKPCPWLRPTAWTLTWCTRGSGESQRSTLLQFRITWYVYITCSKSHSPSPGGLDGEESACNVGELGSIPGLGRSPGEGKVHT